MKCPGQDMQYWKPGAIFEVRCPQCNSLVEFFKDDTARKCGQCGHRFVNPQMDFGCAAYCPYAEQCLGTLPEGLADHKENLLKDRVAVEIKRYFRNDFKRIGRASRVARYAERIGKAERGNLAVILSAAYLHEVGGAEAVVAREILTKLGAQEELIKEVETIIASYPKSAPGDPINLRVVHDANLLESMDEEIKALSQKPDEWAERIDHSFLTAAGCQTARELFLLAR